MALEIQTGYSTLFHQSTPPLNWTKVTTYNDYALRVTTASTIGSGGTINFSSVFNTQSVSLPGTPTGSIGAVALSISQISPHYHTYYYNGSIGAGGQGYNGGQNIGPKAQVAGYNTGSSPLQWGSISGGSDVAHTHPSGDMSVTWSQTGSLDLRIKYIDVIIATRN